MARAPKSPFRSLSGQRPSIQQQLDIMFKGIDALSHHLSEMSLRLEFTMRQIQLTQSKHGGLVGANGKAETRKLSLVELFEEQREVFAQMLLNERAARAVEEAAREIDGAQANGHSGEGVDAGEGAGADPGDEDDTGVDESTSRGATIATFPNPFGKQH